MKNLLKLTFICLLTLLVSTKTEAKGIFIFGTGDEKIEKTADLPDTEDFQMEDGSYVDVGTMYKQVHVFWIPLWNYDVKLCGYVNDDTYMDFETIQTAATSAGVELPTSPSISFWNAYGGKLIALGLIGLMIWGSMGGDDDED